MPGNPREAERVLIVGETHIPLKVGTIAFVAPVPHEDGPDLVGRVVVHADRHRVCGVKLRMGRNMLHIEPEQPGHDGELPVDHGPCPGATVIDSVVERIPPFPPLCVELIDRLVRVELIAFTAIGISLAGPRVGRSTGLKTGQGLETEILVVVFTRWEWDSQ